MLTLGFLFLFVASATAQCNAPSGAEYVFDVCGNYQLGNLSTYLSVNGTSAGGIASLLNVVAALAPLATYDGGIALTYENYTTPETLTADVWLPNATPPQTGVVDVGALLAYGLFSRSSGSGVYPDITQPAFPALAALLSTISTQLTGIQTSLTQALFVAVPIAVNNAGLPIDLSPPIPLAKLLYSALYRPTVVFNDNPAGINVVASQPISTAMITPYFDPNNYVKAGVTLCSVEDTASSPDYPYGTSYSGNDHLVSQSVGNIIVDSVTGLNYESVSTCNYALDSFGTPTLYESNQVVGTTLDAGPFTAQVVYSGP